jgi:hypothetical protein
MPVGYAHADRDPVRGFPEGARLTTPALAGSAREDGVGEFLFVFHLFFQKQIRFDLIGHPNAPSKYSSATPTRTVTPARTPRRDPPDQRRRGRVARQAKLLSGQDWELETHKAVCESS